jgi:hypothetical protein
VTAKSVEAFRLKSIDPSEAQTQAAIIEYLKVCKAVDFFWRQNTGAFAAETVDSRGKAKRRFVRFGCKGASDIIGWTADGRVLAIEVKSPNGRPTPEQKEFLRRVNRAGGIGILARSVDDVVAVLKDV